MPQRNLRTKHGIGGSCGCRRTCQSVLAIWGFLVLTAFECSPLFSPAQAGCSRQGRGVAPSTHVIHGRAAACFLAQKIYLSTALRLAGQLPGVLAAWPRRTRKMFITCILMLIPFLKRFQLSKPCLNFTYIYLYKLRGTRCGFSQAEISKAADLIVVAAANSHDIPRPGQQMRAAQRANLSQL